MFLIVKVVQTSDQDYIISLGETGSTNLKKMYFSATSGSGNTGMGCAGANDITSTQNGVVAGTWTHLVVTCNGWSTSSILYYINNIAYTTNTTSGTNVPLPANNNAFTIGKHSGGGSANFFNGDIDDVAIYNRVLGASGVDSLYNDLGSATACVQYISVTDTLVINNAVITGFTPVTFGNAVKIYPNPSKSNITIDYGDFSSMSGYTIKIINSLSQTVFTTSINHQSDNISFSSWTGKGLYFVQIIDASSKIVDIRKIVLQ